MAQLLLLAIHSIDIAFAGEKILGMVWASAFPRFCFGALFVCWVTVCCSNEKPGTCCRQCDEVNMAGRSPHEPC
jgi:hypothetical protein